MSSIDLSKEKWWTHAGTDEPLCPHCDHEYVIADHDAWNLYEEGEHDIECPSCDKTYVVSVRVSYRFSTDEQPDDE